MALKVGQEVEVWTGVEFVTGEVIDISEPHGWDHGDPVLARDPERHVTVQPEAGASLSVVESWIKAP